MRKHLKSYHKDQWAEYLERRGRREKVRLAQKASLIGMRAPEAAALQDADCSGGNHEELIERKTSRRSQSLLWGSYFERLGDSKAKCNSCGCQVQTTNGNTTGMMRHLQTRHSQEWQLYCQQRSQRKEVKTAEKTNS